VSLAERGFVRRSMAMAQAAVSHARELSHRLSQILAGGNAVGSASAKPRFALVGVSALVLAASISATPEWIQLQAPAAHLAVASVPAAPAVSKLMGGTLKMEAQAAGARPAKFRPETTEPRVLNASRRERNPQKPLVVKAAARNAAPQPQFLVLTQITRYDVYGDSRVSFTLWRVTLPDGKYSLPRAEIIARSL